MQKLSASSVSLSNLLRVASIRGVHCRQRSGLEMSHPASSMILLDEPGPQLAGRPHRVVGPPAIKPNDRGSPLLHRSAAIEESEERSNIRSALEMERRNVQGTAREKVYRDGGAPGRNHCLSRPKVRLCRRPPEACRCGEPAQQSCRARQRPSSQEEMPGQPRTDGVEASVYGSERR
jgi:hypothetical protein